MIVRSCNSLIIQIMSHADGKGHRCQIDCTNHDQVITGLQLKSKDLYYFWRNYEWLYNKYYSAAQEPAQPKTQPAQPAHERCQQQIESLQQENDKLVRQNKKLKMEVEAMRRQLGDQDSQHKLEQNYKLQLEKERNNAREYMQMHDRQLAENKKLKNSIAALEEQHEAQRNKLIKENKKALQTILELQQTLDELRARPATLPHSNAPPAPPPAPSYAEFEELSRRQTTTISSRIKMVATQAEQIVKQEYQGLRRQLEDRLAEMLSELTQRQLQSVVVSLQQ